METPAVKITAVLLALGTILLAAACGKQPDNPEPETTTNDAVITDAQQTTEEAPANATTQAPETTTSAPDAELTSAPSAEVTTAASTPEAESTTEKTAPATTEEIVSLFNESANKIKTDAILVVKNYEKRTVNEEHVSIPKAIESVAEGMLKTFMKDDLDPIPYSTREEIRTDFPVPNQSYVSKLKAGDVEAASCKDTGKTYEIYFKLKTSVNPTAGTGVGSVCDVIETYDVANGPAFIEEFSTKYYNCEIKAVYNKASGRITHINYKTPLVLNLKVDLLGTHSGSIGFTFEKDYSVTY